MASQAIIARLFLPMAGHASFHADRDGLARDGRFFFAHIPMTESAIELGDLHVPAMGKINMGRHAIDSNPGNLLLVRGVSPNQPGFRIILLAMARKASLQGGKSGMRFMLRYARVALATLQTQISNVLLVAVGNRLRFLYAPIGP